MGFPASLEIRIGIEGCDASSLFLHSAYNIQKGSVGQIISDEHRR
jgi:hypothetical protein